MDRIGFRKIAFIFIFRCLLRSRKLKSRNLMKKKVTLIRFLQIMAFSDHYNLQDLPMESQLNLFTVCTIHPKLDQF